jgi:sulfatase maturation enzyme AslB (radical SAM superfamily)
MKEHYDILDICIKHRKFDIRLAYNSNLTILETKKYNIFDYWKNFKKVGLNASIDAGWEQFEFIRSGGDWAKVVENLKQIKQLPNVHVTITPTVAFWNMIHIPKVYKYLRENNLLGRQTHNFGGEILRHDLLKPSVLPLAYKNYIRELYETEYKEYPEVKVLLKYLDDDDSHLLPETKKYVEELGKKQNCDIYSVFPEFKDIFNGLQ